MNLLTIPDLTKAYRAADAAYVEAAGKLALAHGPRKRCRAFARLDIAESRRRDALLVMWNAMDRQGAQP